MFLIRLLSGPYIIRGNPEYFARIGNDNKLYTTPDAEGAVKFPSIGMAEDYHRMMSAIACYEAEFPTLEVAEAEEEELYEANFAERYGR